MTDATHTPGPWCYQPTAGHHDFMVYCEATGRDVALVRDFNLPNARLITAAPAMLETLRNVETVLSEKNAQPLLSEVRAAIAEATRD